MSDSSAIRAGRAYIEMFLDREKLVSGLRDAGKYLQGWGTQIAKVGAVFGGLGAAIKAPLALAANAFAELGSKFADSSVKTGLSARTLSQLSYAAKTVGSDLGAVESALDKMDTFLDKAADGAKLATAEFGRFRPVGKELTDTEKSAQKAAKGLAELGLSVAKLEGLSPDRKMALIGARLGLIQDPAEAAAKAVKIFGENGKALLPMLQTLGSLRNRAEELGLVMSDHDAAAAKQFSNSLGLLKYSFDFLKSSIGAAVAGEFQRWTDWTATAIASVAKWLNQNRAFVRGISSLGSALVIAGTTLGAIGGGLAVLGTSLGGVATVIATAGAAIGAAFAFLLTPVGALSAALVAGGGAWLVYSGTGSKAIATVTRIIGSLYTDFNQAWKGMSAALHRGDLPAAVGVVFQLLGKEFGRGISSIGRAWSAFQNAIVSTAKAIAARVQPILASAWAGIKSALGETLSGLSGPLAQLSGWFGVVGETLAAFGSRGKAALDYLAGAFNTLKTDAIESFQGIAGALTGNDLGLAAQILWAALEMEWQRGTVALTDIWLRFKLAFMNVATEAAFGAIEIFNNAWAGIKTAWVETTSFLSEKWDTFAGFLEDSWTSTVAFVQSCWAPVEGIFDFLADAFGTVCGGIQSAWSVLIAGMSAAMAPLVLAFEGMGYAYEALVGGGGDTPAAAPAPVDVGKVARDEQRAKRGSDRDKQRQTRRDQIETDRVAANASAGGRRDAARGRNQQDYDTGAAGNDEARAALAETKARLDELVAKGKAAGKTSAETARNTLTKDVKLPTQSELQRTSEKVSSSGTFNAAAVRGLERGGIQERIAKAVEQTAANTKKKPNQGAGVGFA
ncbi:hypothetical protein BH11PLA2_BH11PLA2_34630 [soil metagenome]